MTPQFLMTKEAFAALGAPDLVYVRPVSAAQVLAEAPKGRLFRKGPGLRG